MKNIVYFDLETQKSAEEVGGWDHINRMGMSVGVTYSTAQGAYRIYGEKQVSELITDLQRATWSSGSTICDLITRCCTAIPPLTCSSCPRWT